MELGVITEGIPDELKMQLMDNERVRFFHMITFKGGCLRASSKDEHWIAITDKRVFYRTKILEANNIAVKKDGILPLEKISFVEVSEVKLKGCLGIGKKLMYSIRLSTSGGIVAFPLPTKELAYEIRMAYTQIMEEKGHGQ